MGNPFTDISRRIHCEALATKSWLLRDTLNLCTRLDKNLSFFPSFLFIRWRACLHDSHRHLKHLENECFELKIQRNCPARFSPPLFLYGAKHREFEKKVGGERRKYGRKETVEKG